MKTYFEVIYENEGLRGSFFTDDLTKALKFAAGEVKKTRESDLPAKVNIVPIYREDTD